MAAYQAKQNLLAERTILVTGAGDGIGREAALTFARFGAELLLLGRTEAKLNAVKEEIIANGGNCRAIITLDLQYATPEQYQQLAAELSGQLPYLDGLLHNAALLGDIMPLAELSAATWQAVMQVNVNAAFMLTQALLPLLLKAPAASLVFTSSSVGRTGRANWGAYAVSKFATEGMMQVLADEYQADALRVNCINPGATRTDMRAAAFPQEDKSLLQTAADIMPLYLYLMGDDSIGRSGESFDAKAFI
ncbi:YciK family oxidoreductase [Serratia microhaemolytica]|uniref:YciK family oxidoreductase n=1 Tax=Serratia microhaemolytica TaxID=2675110 RepID=UPI000FDDB67C|nr:YciK family oxidoreductase [Serratia microhaemolytica]